MDRHLPSRATRYRKRAEEVRSAAESVHLLGARESMLQIAHAYDLLAEQVEGADLPSLAQDALID